MGKAYYDATYWMKRYGLIVLCATAVCVLIPGKYKKMKQLTGLLTAGGLLTSLGSKNAVYSSINNGFLLMSCVLWLVYDFFGAEKRQRFFL